MIGSPKIISPFSPNFLLICVPLFSLAMGLNCDGGERLVGDKCIPCEPGTFRFWAYNNSPKCTRCRGGTFYSFTGARLEAFCHICPKNTYSKPASAKCTKCPKGQISGVGYRKCIQLCQPGFGRDDYEDKWSPCRLAFFNDGTQIYCHTCPSGTTTIKRGAAKCIPCPAGSFRDIRFLRSLEKPPVQCKECPNNSFSKAGATQCELCPVGSVPNRGRDSCKPCTAGTYRRMISSSKCMKCPTGTSSEGNQPAGCKHPKHGCPVHTFEDLSGECRGCMPGQRLEVINKTCVPCKLNEASAGGDSTTCEQCPKNSAPETELSIFERARCRCSPGFKPVFSGERSDSICVPCPAGTHWVSFYNILYGKLYQRRLQLPKNPYYKACPRGYYSDKPGMVKCKICPPGTISRVSVPKQCEKCPKGSRPRPLSPEFFLLYPSFSGAEECIQLKNACRVGQVRLSNGYCIRKSRTCPLNHFPSGRYCRACGRTSRYDPEKKDCAYCENHEWNANQSDQHMDTKCVACGREGAFIGPGCKCNFDEVRAGDGCKACPFGTFASISGVCKDCPANKVPVTSFGRNWCAKCSGNTYKARLTDQKCTKCPTGSRFSRDFLGRRMNGCMSQLNYTVLWMNCVLSSKWAECFTKSLIKECASNRCEDLDVFLLPACSAIEM